MKMSFWGTSFLFFGLTFSILQGCSSSGSKQEKELFNIKFDEDQYYSESPKGLGGVTFINNQLQMERANDQYSAKQKMVGWNVVNEGAVIFTAPGSSIRFTEKYKNNHFKVDAPENQRLHFRKTKEGWVYLSGKGTFWELDTKKKYKLGAKRDLGWFRKNLDSEDTIIKERALYELEWYPKYYKKKDIHSRVKELLTADHRYIKTAASFAMRQLGTKSDLKELKAAIDAEKETYVTNALKDAYFKIESRK